MTAENKGEAAGAPRPFGIEVRECKYIPEGRIFLISQDQLKELERLERAADRTMIEAAGKIMDFLEKGAEGAGPAPQA